MTDGNYIGGIGNNILYRERSYIKVGSAGDKTSYRGVILLSPKQQIESTIKQATGNTAQASYKIGKANLSVTSVDRIFNPPNLYAAMLPLDSLVDDTVSWSKHSEYHNTSWTNTGGDVEPLAKDILIKGYWNDTVNPTTITFDLTDYFSIWKASGKESFSIAIVEDGSSGKVFKFYSNESRDVVLGGELLTNCRFFTGTEAQLTAIEGVRVLMIPSGTTTSISLVDQSCEAQKRWNTFNSAATIGSTCSIFSPDTEQGLVLGSNVCTITDKNVGVAGASIVVSGLCLGSISNYYTTAEFSTTKNINSGRGYVEFTNPSQNLLDGINDLSEGNVVSVNYTATTSPNNARQYTVLYTANEKNTLNRARIYFNEQVVSEDRNGLHTEFRLPSYRPTLQAQIVV